MSGQRSISAVFLGLCLVIVPLMAGDIDARDFLQGLEIPDVDHLQILTTHDGSTMIGRIVEIHEEEIQFQTDFGTTMILISKVKEIRLVPRSAMRNGKYWFPNPNSTRLFFAPTARQLKKGAGYFSDYYLFFPGISYGVTDHITVGGGISLFPGVDMNEQLFYFTPKVGISASENFHLAAGLLLAKVPDEVTAGIVYGVGTYGGTNSHLTAGFGYGFVDGDVEQKPMVMVGGEHRLSRHMAFVTENWIFPGVDQPLVSGGIRFLGEKLSVDLALFTLLGEDTGVIPYVDFVFNF